MSCRICSKHEDSQIESMNCPELVEEGESREKNVEEYMKIFDDDIPEETIKRVQYIIRKREKNMKRKKPNMAHVSLFVLLEELSRYVNFSRYWIFIKSN